MVYEHAVLTITPGGESEFEAAFARAPAVFARVPGSHDVELQRCVEERSRYLVLLGWDDVEAHMAFRESPLFAEWRGIVGDFFAEPPVVHHYEVVAT